MNSAGKKYNILVAEDEANLRAEIINLLNMLGHNVLVAADGNEAREIISQHDDIMLYIFDLHMPHMNGDELVRFLKEKDPSAVIIMQTGEDDRKAIIQVMKHGVYDYIIKPIDPEKFMDVVQKAIEFRERIDEDNKVSIHVTKKIKEELSWMTYKLNQLTDGKNLFNKDSINDIRTSFTQGQGIGAGISLIKLLDLDKREHDEHNYLINKDVFHLAVENNKTTEMVFEGIGTLEELLNTPVNFQEVPVGNLSRVMEQTIANINRVYGQNIVKVNYGKINEGRKVKIDLDLMMLALEELCVNAIKYSLKNSVVNVILGLQSEHYSIIIKNQITNTYSIPREKEEEIIRPFRRLCPPVEEHHTLEKFGVGLGLTAVDYIVKQHTGMLSVKEVTDHSRGNEKNVWAEIMIPLM